MKHILTTLAIIFSFMYSQAQTEIPVLSNERGMRGPTLNTKLRYVKLTTNKRKIIGKIDIEGYLIDSVIIDVVFENQTGPPPIFKSSSVFASRRTAAANRYYYSAPRKAAKIKWYNTPINSNNGTNYFTLNFNRRLQHGRIYIIIFAHGKQSTFYNEKW
jgi:hypothetical protein